MPGTSGFLTGFFYCGDRFESVNFRFMKIPYRVLFCAVWVFGLSFSAFGQWTNRYPKLAGVSHHVYLEGFNLPTMNHGATDPAISPDNRRLAFAARGWIWVMDLDSRAARRITKDRRDGRPSRVVAGRETDRVCQGRLA